jgi:hypothetical protein
MAMSDEQYLAAIGEAIDRRNGGRADPGFKASQLNYYLNKRYSTDPDEASRPVEYWIMRAGMAADPAHEFGGSAFGTVATMPLGKAYQSSMSDPAATSDDPFGSKDRQALMSIMGQLPNASITQAPPVDAGATPPERKTTYEDVGTKMKESQPVASASDQAFGQSGGMTPAVRAALDALDTPSARLTRPRNVDRDALLSQMGA